MNGHPRLWRLFLDTVVFAAGVFMLLHETLTRDPHWPTLIVALVLLSGPATIRTVVEAFFRKEK